MISVLIVIYNPGDELFQCIQRLIDTATYTPLEIIVVDNHSTNEVAQTLSRRFSQIKLIQSDKNLGFGGGNNLAFAHSSGKYVMCVNPDLIVDTDTLQYLRQYLDESPLTGVVGPRTIDDTGNIVQTVRAKYTWWRLWARYWQIDVLLPQLVHGRYWSLVKKAKEPFEADWLQGSCLLMRREVYKEVNGFDENFFLYMEDTDLCDRIHEAGWKVVYVPQATAIHYGGMTTSKHHLIRIRSYHISPLYYYRKRGRKNVVKLLKFVFIIEILMKVLTRRLANFFSYRDERRRRAQAELQVLSEVWNY